MNKLTVLSKQQPGGRCTLYIRYAEAIIRDLGLDIEVIYCEPNSGQGEPPAMLINAMPVEPSDGVIISPEDLLAGLGASFAQDKLVTLQQHLNAVQEQLMEEWANG